jgi:hypothetical protein
MRVLKAIGNALIAVTPEHWKSATLELLATQATTLMVGLVHTITTPEGHRDLIAPTEELMAATARLQSCVNATEGRSRELYFRCRVALSECGTLPLIGRTSHSALFPTQMPSNPPLQRCRRAACSGITIG